MKKIFSLIAAVLFAGSMMAELKTYTLTLNPTDFTTTSYANNDGDHTFKAVATDDSKMDVVITTKDIMQSASLIQGKKSSCYIYNKTNLGAISSITITQEYANFVAVIGSVQQPTEAVANGGYFNITNPSNYAAKASKIEIVFSKDDNVAVTGVSLDITSKSIEEGESFTLTPTIIPADATNAKVSWESSDETVAVVADGLVTGVAAGSATITVTTEDGNKTAECEVTVTAAVPTEYVETAFKDIKDEDEVVITMTIDSVAKTFALNGDGATGSAPKADLVRIVGTSIKPVAEGHIFLVSAVTGGYQFALKSDPTKLLNIYANNDDSQNNNVRVSTPSGTATGVWNFDANNHLFATPASDARYLCVYTSSDFRTYKSTSGGYANVEAQTLKFFVKSIGGDPVVPTAIENTAAEVKVVKVIENGQMFIIKNGVKYNAQGAVVR